jgi:peptidoglycan-N-acetylglucosamine deacetylase
VTSASAAPWRTWLALPVVDLSARVMVQISTSTDSVHDGCATSRSGCRMQFVEVAGMEQRAGASIVGMDGPCNATILTYDDGPKPGDTDAILHELNRRGATATFFVLLTRARRSPGHLADMLAAGHEVALHGPDHRRLTELDPGTVDAHVKDARSELEDLAGVPVRWFRPPYGSQNPVTWQAVLAAGLTPVLWTVDCKDWRTQSLDEYLAPVRQPSLRRGIVLLHDGFADASDGVDDGSPPRVDKARLTRSILDEAERRGLSVHSVGNALETEAPAWRIWLDELGSAS